MTLLEYILFVTELLTFIVFIVVGAAYVVFCVARIAEFRKRRKPRDDAMQQPLDDEYPRTFRKEGN